MAWSSDQLSNAAVIITVGRRLGASKRDIQIALMTALVESNLHNVNYGDRDSLGLFQQRSAWGSRSQRMDPYQSAAMFFQGGQAGQRGLFDIPGRNTMSMGAAAQAVQVSAFPDRYAERQGQAADIMGQLGDFKVPDPNPGPTSGGRTLGEATPAPMQFKSQPKVTSQTEAQPTVGEALADTLGNLGRTPQDVSSPVGEFSNPALSEFSNSALGEAHNSALDTSSSIELNGVNAPKSGTTDWRPITLPNLEDYGVTLDPMGNVTTGDTATSASGAGWAGQVISGAKKFLGTPYVWGGTSPSGFDCSGFVQYVYRQVGINLPRISADQARSGPRVALKDLRPGDLVGWDNSSRNNGADHIAIYIGGGKIIEAPRPGSSVQVSHLYDTDRAWGVRINR